MTFFKETAKYKEMLLLEFISNNKEISQVNIANHINASVSMTHTYIEELELKGFLSREYKSKKIVRYNISKEGISRKKYLQIRYVRELMEIYLKGHCTISLFLDNIVQKEFKNILFYGAGDVANILLNMINIENLNLNVVGIIDDDKNKIGRKLQGVEVISLSNINKFEHDGIIITSYTYEDSIVTSLQDKNYPKEKIIRYFERG